MLLLRLKSLSLFDQALQIRGSLLQLGQPWEELTKLLLDCIDLGVLGRGCADESPELLLITLSFCTKFCLFGCPL